MGPKTKKSSKKGPKLVRTPCTLFCTKLKRSKNGPNGQEWFKNYSKISQKLSKIEPNMVQNGQNLI